MAVRLSLSRRRSGLALGHSEDFGGMWEGDLPSRLTHFHLSLHLHLNLPLASEVYTMGMVGAIIAIGRPQKEALEGRQGPWWQSRPGHYT